MTSMNRYNLLLLFFVSPLAFTQPTPPITEIHLGEWSIEEFTLHTDKVFLSAAGQGAVGHRLLFEFLSTVDQCDSPIFSFWVSTASFYQHRKALGDEAFDTWLENEFKGSEIGISLQVADYETKEFPFRITQVFNPVDDMIGHPVFRTAIVGLVNPYIPLWLISGSGKAVTLTISENSPLYSYFDMRIESFPLEGFDEAVNEAHALCKKKLDMQAPDGVLAAL